jgi:hypothetical protein
MARTQKVRAKFPSGKSATSDITVVARDGRRLRLPQTLRAKPSEPQPDPKPEAKTPSDEKATVQRVHAKPPAGKTGESTITAKNQDGKQAGINYVPDATLGYLLAAYSAFSPDWTRSWLTVDAGALTWKPISRSPSFQHTASGGYIYYRVYGVDGYSSTGDVWRTSYDGTVDEYAFTLPSYALSLNPVYWGLQAAGADANNTYWMTYGLEQISTWPAGNTTLVYRVYKVSNGTNTPIQFCEPMYDARLANPWNYTLEAGYIDATPMSSKPIYGMTVSEQGVFVYVHHMKTYHQEATWDVWYDELLHASASGTNWTRHLLLEESSGIQPWGLSWVNTRTNMYDYYGITSMYATSTDVFFVWTHTWRDFTPPYVHSYIEFRAFNLSTGIRVIDTDQVSKQIIWARGQELLWQIRSGSDVLFYYTNDNCTTFTLIGTFTTSSGNPDFRDSGRVSADVYFREFDGAITGALKLSSGVLTQETIT